MLFTAASHCALMESGGRFCRNGFPIPRATSRETTRDCGGGREINLDSAMTWLDISSNGRKTGRCCWGKRRWFEGCSGETGEAPVALPTSWLADFFTPVFESLFYHGHELVGHGTVDDAMVVTQREVNDGTDGDGICPVLVGDHQGLFGDTADAHDGDIRLVDDGQAEDGAKLAGVGNGEGGTFDISRHELLRTGSLSEVGDAALQSEEIELVGILENGDNESPIK